MGDLVISNDEMLGWISTFENEVVILATYCTIFSIKNSQLPLYFPKGYKIRKNKKVFDDKSFSGSISGTVGTF